MNCGVGVVLFYFDHGCHILDRLSDLSLIRLVQYRVKTQFFNTFEPLRLGFAREDIEPSVTNDIHIKLTNQMC